MKTHGDSGWQSHPSYLDAVVPRVLEFLAARKLTITFFIVGIDAAKARNAVAVAEGGRGGEVRYLGEVDASEQGMRRVVARIAAKYDRVHFCYEAGPTGYGLHRLITGLGHACTVVAPSLVPRKPGDRVKTNRRDAV